MTLYTLTEKINTLLPVVNFLKCVVTEVLFSIVALRHCYFTGECSDTFEVWWDFYLIVLLQIFSWFWRWNNWSTNIPLSASLPGRGTSSQSLFVTHSLLFDAIRRFITFSLVLFRIATEPRKCILTFARHYDAVYNSYFFLTQQRQHARIGWELYVQYVTSFYQQQ